MHEKDGPGNNLIYSKYIIDHRWQLPLGTCKVSPSLVDELSKRLASRSSLVKSSKKKTAQDGTLWGNWFRFVKEDKIYYFQIKPKSHPSSLSLYKILELEVPEMDTIYAHDTLFLEKDISNEQRSNDREGSTDQLEGHIEIIEKPLLFCSKIIFKVLKGDVCSCELSKMEKDAHFESLSDITKTNVLSSMLLNCIVTVGMNLKLYLNDKEILLKVHSIHSDTAEEPSHTKTEHFLIGKETRLEYMAMDVSCSSMEKEYMSLIPLCYHGAWTQLASMIQSFSSSTSKGIVLKGSQGSRKNEFVVFPPIMMYGIDLNESEHRLEKAFEDLKRVYTIHSNNPCILLLEDMGSFLSIKNSSLSKRSSLSFKLIHLIKNITMNAFVVLTVEETLDLDPIFLQFLKPDNIITLPSLSYDDRVWVITHWAHSNNLVVDFNISELVKLTHGFTYGQLKTLCRHIQIYYATHHAEEPISLNCILALFNKQSLFSNSKLNIHSDEEKTWEEIGGYEDIKKVIRQSIEWPIKYTNTYKRLGLVPSHGILLYGPPGCSKTSLARVVSKLSGYYFSAYQSAELYSCYIGESEKQLRYIFKTAREKAPSVLFFDELDALVGTRSIGDTNASGTGAASNESGPANKDAVQERILSTFLNEMDGVEALKGVVVMAATNRLDRIDPALLRPGRFDKLIHVPLPDLQTRKAIFKIQMDRMPTRLGSSILIDRLAQMSEGWSGAQCVHACQEAGLLALRENPDSEYIENVHFYLALESLSLEC